MRTHAILIASFYPPAKPKLKRTEIEKKGKYWVIVSCKAYVGYPPGKLVLSVDGIDNLDVGKVKKTDAKSKKGKVWALKAVIPAMMEFNGTKARCVSGGGENPLRLNASKVLDVQVPVNQARIKNPAVVFRHPGGRLECEATGNPPPEYSWTFNHMPVNDTSSSLEIPRKPGVYEATCRVTNEVLGKNHTSKYPFHFAVVPEAMPCSNIRAEDSAHVAFIVATVLAVIFAIIALIVVVILIVTKKKSGYDKM